MAFFLAGTFAKAGCLCVKGIVIGTGLALQGEEEEYLNMRNLAQTISPNPI